MQEYAGCTLTLSHRPRNESPLNFLLILLLLCSTALYCALLCSTVLYCALLCSTVLRCAECAGAGVLRVLLCQ
eukprot:3767230-Pyramimonas_sp.AAC.2